MVESSEHFVSEISKEKIIPSVIVIEKLPLNKIILGIYKIRIIEYSDKKLLENYATNIKLLQNLVLDYIIKKRFNITFLNLKKCNKFSSENYLIVTRKCRTSKCIKETQELIYQLFSILMSFGFVILNKKTMYYNFLKKEFLRKIAYFIAYYNVSIDFSENFEEIYNFQNFNKYHVRDTNIPLIKDLVNIYERTENCNIGFFLNISTKTPVLLGNSRSRYPTTSVALLTLKLGLFTDKKSDKTVWELYNIISTSISLNYLHKSRNKKIFTNDFLKVLMDIPLLIPTNSIKLLDLFQLLKSIFFFLSALDSEKNIDGYGYTLIKERMKGDIFIGKQIPHATVEVPFYLNIEDINRHLAIIGPSGKGKTKLAIQIIKEIVDKNLGNVWIFDFHGEYRFLSRKGFLVLIPSSLTRPVSLNIFESSDENPAQYAYFLSRLILETIDKQEYEISPQMERAIQEAVYKTLANSFDYLRNPIGFIKNLIEWQIKANEIGFPAPTATFHALINRINSLFSGPMGSVLWTISTNINISELLDKNVIFDLSYLTKKGALRSDLIILVNVILRLLFSYLSRRERKSDKRIYLFVEEARYLVPWRMRKSTADTTALEDFAILARKYGLSLVTISQSLNSISEDILSNVGTIFLFGLEDSKEIKRTDDDSHSNGYNLPPRYAIVKLSEIPATTLIKVKEVEDNNLLGDENTENVEIMKTIISRYRPIPFPFSDLIAKLETFNNVKELDKQVLEIIKKIDRLFNTSSTCKDENIAKTIILTLLIKNNLLRNGQTDLLFQKIRDKPHLIFEESNEIHELKKLIHKDKIRTCLNRTLTEILKALELDEERLVKYEFEDILSNLIFVL